MCYVTRYCAAHSPALCCELSGLPWDGPASSGFSSDTDWEALKPRTPFGQ